jgi:hypothetical protein
VDSFHQLWWFISFGSVLINFDSNLRRRGRRYREVFMVLSDPVVVREVLKEKPFAFSKGVLAEILEPIMARRCTS